MPPARPRRIDEVLVLLQVPNEARERGLEELAEDLTAIAWELEDASYALGGPCVEQVLAVQNLVDEAGRLLRDSCLARHQAALAALEVLCAHCGHDRGDHLVDAPHACEHEDDVATQDGVEGTCGCAGFVPPGQYRDTMRTLHDADTEPPPAPSR